MAKELVSTLGNSLSPLNAPSGHAVGSARSAQALLLMTAERMNLRAEPHSSAISAVKLYDRENRYLFAWIVNAHHLLFYVRKPALKLRPSLVEQAQRLLRGAKLNPAGEVTIRIETLADAQALVSWLFDPATWSERKLSEAEKILIERSRDRPPAPTLSLAPSKIS